MPEYGRPKYKGLFTHAPGGYYLCRNNFTINEIFVEPTNESYPDYYNDFGPSPIFRPREVYKKKNGKGNLLRHLSKGETEFFNLLHCTT